MIDRLWAGHGGSLDGILYLENRTLFLNTGDLLNRSNGTRKDRGPLKAALHSCLHYHKCAFSFHISGNHFFPAVK
jgi:hypothetical protein